MQQVARAAFPNGTLCLHIADVLGPLYTAAQFTDLFPRRGQPAAVLTAVLLMRYGGGLTGNTPLASHGQTLAFICAQ
jgi:hypothetical protein